MKKPKINTLELLRRTRKLLENHWTQKTYYDPEKDAFCIQGGLAYEIAKVDGKDIRKIENPGLALMAYLMSEEYFVARKYLEKILRSQTRDLYLLGELNDKTTHEQVLDLLDKAIALKAEKKTTRRKKVLA